MMAASSSALDSVYLDMVRYLNIPNLRPYLRQQHMLTEDEFEKLDITPGITTKQAVENLIKILKRKGPGHEHQFLAILKRSMEEDPHLGHEPIIQALEDRLAQIQSGYSSEEMESDGIVLPGVSISNSTPYQQAFKDSPVGPVQLRHMPVQHQKHTLELVGSDEHISDPRKAALRCKVIQANEGIVTKFASLALGIFRLLKQKQVPVDEVRMGLLYLGCLQDRSKEHNIQIFSPTSDIAQANTLQSLIECLHRYSSWYNYGLLKFAAIEFGKEDGKQLIGDYEMELAHYFETIIAYQCPHFSLTTGIPMGFDHLIVKVEWDYMSRKAQDIAIFQSKLSTLLKLEPEVFILKSVEEGCMKFTWAIPAPIVEYVLSEVFRLRDDLAEEDVTLVHVGGKRVECNKKPIVSESVVEEAQFGGVQMSSTIKQHPRVVIPVCEKLSNESFLSSLSELTSKSSASELGGYPDKRLSNNSSLIDIERNSLTAEEIEILSIYSGTGSLDLNASNTHTTSSSPVLKNNAFNSPSPQSKILVKTAIQQAPNDIKESLQTSRPFFSESDLLDDVETSDSTLSSSKVRTLSLPNCSGTENHSGAFARKQSKFNRAKKFLRQLLHSRRMDNVSQNDSPASTTPPKLQLLNLTEEPSPSSRWNPFHYYHYTEDDDPQTISSKTSPNTPQSSLSQQTTTSPINKHASPYTSTVHSSAQFRSPSPILVSKDSHTGLSPLKESMEFDSIISLDDNSPTLPPRFRSHSAPRKLLQNQLHAMTGVLPGEDFTRARGNSLTVPPTTLQCSRSTSFYTPLYRHIMTERVASPVSVYSSQSSGYASQNDVDSMMSSRLTSQESLYQIPSRTSSLKYRNFKVYSTQLSNSRSAFGSTAERHSFH